MDLVTEEAPDLLQNVGSGKTGGDASGEIVGKNETPPSDNQEFSDTSDQTAMLQKMLLNNNNGDMS